MQTIAQETEQWARFYILKYPRLLYPLLQERQLWLSFQNLETIISPTYGLTFKYKKVIHKAWPQ